MRTHSHCLPGFGTIMTRNTIAARSNLEIIEAAYQQWRRDPVSVDQSWRLFFEGFDLGLEHKPAAATDGQHFGIIRLIDAYRGLGHLLARLDPLSGPPARHPLLELAEFGFKEGDLDRVFDT